MKQKMKINFNKIVTLIIGTIIFIVFMAILLLGDIIRYGFKTILISMVAFFIMFFCIPYVFNRFNRLFKKEQKEKIKK